MIKVLGALFLSLSPNIVNDFFLDKCIYFSILLGGRFTFYCCVYLEVLWNTSSLMSSTNLTHLLQIIFVVVFLRKKKILFLNYFMV